MQYLQKGASEEMLQGQEVRTSGGIELSGKGTESGKKFIKIRCQDCGNEQIVFRKPAIDVNCLVCGASLIKPMGGKGLVRGKIVGEMT